MAELVHDHTPDPEDPESCLHACRACLIEAGIGEDLDPPPDVAAMLAPISTADVGDDPRGV